MCLYVCYIYFINFQCLAKYCIYIYVCVCIYVFMYVCMYVIFILLFFSALRNIVFKYMYMSVCMLYLFYYFPVPCEIANGHTDPALLKVLLQETQTEKLELGNTLICCQDSSLCL